MKILGLDIETAPNTAHVWGLWKQNIGINQIQQTGRVLCHSSKWVGSKAPVAFSSEFHEDPVEMLVRAWALLDEADVVLTFNGKSFDIPMLNRDFLKLGWSPPSPYKHIDLYRVSKDQFRFPSHKMDYLCRELDLATKIRHEGHELWTRCMDGDAKAWTKMMRYNKRDVNMLLELYQEMRPWIRNHPNAALYLGSPPDRPLCPSCGSRKVVKRGIQHNATQSYQRYQCSDCSSWSRSRFTLVPKNQNILTST